ncbi:hypothetical protein M5K25_009569 [Dendrobium thyrsiflorum]|uniref:Uncharacterized protein n=1 Tax=Dendrobium thyrsiflorum TaxID=117978 RepID=A0ABD0V5S4_DENTH
MANPEHDFGIVYDDQGLILILQSPFFDVDPEVDHTVNDYIERILETVVMAVEDQLGTVEWRLAADPKFILILQSPFFDVDPEVDHTVNDYIERILETVVMAVEDQLGTVEWRLAADPK